MNRWLWCYICKLQVVVLGWGTQWHPIYFLPIFFYSGNAIIGPFLLRSTREDLTKNLFFLVWFQGISALAILSFIIGLIAGSTILRQCLPFKSTTTTTVVTHILVRPARIDLITCFIHCFYGVFCSFITAAAQ